MKREIISLACLLCAVAGVSAQEAATAEDDSMRMDTVREAADSLKRDTSDVVVIRRVPLESGRTIDDEVIVVDTIPSSNEGVNIVLLTTIRGVMSATAAYRPTTIRYSHRTGIRSSCRHTASS